MMSADELYQALTNDRYPVYSIRRLDIATAVAAYRLNTQIDVLEDERGEPFTRFAMGLDQDTMARIADQYGEYLSHCFLFETAPVVGDLYDIVERLLPVAVSSLPKDDWED